MDYNLSQHYKNYWCWKGGDIRNFASKASRLFAKLHTSRDVARPTLMWKNSMPYSGEEFVKEGLVDSATLIWTVMRNEHEVACFDFFFSNFGWELWCHKHSPATYICPGNKLLEHYGEAGSHAVDERHSDREESIYMITWFPQPLPAVCMMDPVMFIVLQH